MRKLLLAALAMFMFTLVGPIPERLLRSPRTLIIIPIGIGIPYVHYYPYAGNRSYQRKHRHYHHRNR